MLDDKGQGQMGRGKVRLGTDKPEGKGQARGEGTSQMGRDKPDGKRQGQIGKGQAR